MPNTLLKDDVQRGAQLSGNTEKSMQAELLVSAALHLMSHYSVNSISAEGNNPCLKLASVIERHLKALSDLPDLTPVLRATCQQLSEQWASLIDNNLPRHNKIRRFSWLTPATSD